LCGVEAKDNGRQRQFDMAVIAASIHYATLQREATYNSQAPVARRNRWKMSGRSALREAARSISFRGKKVRK
jgi:hypothetical protein